MTPTIDVSDADFGALGVLAKVFGTDRAGAVSRLVEGFAGEADLDDPDLPETKAASPKTLPDPDDDVELHASYKGQHVTALLGKPTNSVTITSGPLEGEVFKTPSAAARAFVGLVDPTVNPHRNGWGFWVVTATGEPAQSVRYRPRNW